MTIALNSDDRLANVDHHFRVTAGPGAGKTHWLVLHLQNVVRTSTRLTPSSRIAVLSYTNVAVSEVIGRLQDAADSVDASTIHSFLYRHVVRPYAHLLRDSAGNALVAHQLIDGHAEHYPSRTHLDDWINANGKGTLRSAPMKTLYARVRSLLRSLTVRINDAGEAYLTARKLEPWDRSIRTLFEPDKLLDYKRRYWNEGTIDHEDVLFFAHRLLDDNPVLRQFLSARFPYLFVDEFQDTLPVQAMLVRWLAEQGSVVGVIGDPEQAIFGFLEASPRHFRDFKLADHRAYSIVGNRRSTESIVNFLNKVRTDGLVQTFVRHEVGRDVIVYGGSLASALAEAKRATPDPAQMLVLAREHKTLLKLRVVAAAATTDPWEILEDADGYRQRLLYQVAAAINLARRGMFDLAIQRIVQGICGRRHFRKPFEYDGDVDLLAKRNLAFVLLVRTLKSYDGLLAGNALGFFDMIRAAALECVDGLKLPKVLRGKFHEAAKACTCESLFQALRTPEASMMNRVIHQAKGVEAPAVFVILDEDQIKHITAPTANDEEQRITYVALSRARDTLSIFCPNASRLAEFAVLPNCVTRLLPTLS